MKKPITLALALLSFASVAQWNNTYDINANSDELHPAFVITNKKAESITVSYANNAEKAVDYFILTKHKCTGENFYNNVITPFNAPDDGLTNVEALIQTDDEGVLVAGYHYDDSKHIEQPFLLKVDYYGNVQWVKIYYVNKSPIARSGINKISLCRVANDDKENYFIVGAGDSDAKGRSGRDVVNNVIKVDADGVMLFSKKYYHSNFDEFTVVRDYPGDMEFASNDEKYPIYMITGHRVDATSASSGRHMYYLGIDNNGKVATKYMRLTSKSYPIDQDMIYDAKENKFATVFTHEKSGYVEGTGSVIGFINVWPTLAFADQKFLGHREAIAHNGRSISMCKSGEYVLGSGVLDGKSLIYNPSWLKVYNDGYPSGPLTRYNVDDNVIFGHHATTYDCENDKNPEAYTLVNEHKSDLREIRPDENGKVCGSVQYEPYAKEYDLKDEYYEYIAEEVGEYERYKVYEYMFDPEYRKCKDDASSYRTTGIAKISNTDGTTALYPTVMSSSNAYITVENNTGVNVKMEVRNIAGQVVFTSNELGAGKTGMNITAKGSLSQGIYLVNIYTGNGALTQTSKIVITE